MVHSTPDNTLLRSKVSNLATNHESLFRCAVVPGFWIKGFRSEIPPFPSLFAALLIPVAAATFRNVLLIQELIQANQLASLTLSALMDDFGIIPPDNDRLLWNP